MPASLQHRRNDPRLVREPSFVLREMTAPLRALPSFLIIGAMKAGTSSLFQYLVQHPQIARPYRKELHYFTIGQSKGKRWRWYRAHFPRRSSLPPHTVTGEATPGYLFAPGAAKAIAQKLPDVRLIVLLRDPVERTLSHYFHAVRMGRETLSLEEALSAEEERLATVDLRDPVGLETYLQASYKGRGHYSEQIEQYLEAFPRDRLHIAESKTLFADPAAVVADTLRFLGLPPMPRAVEYKVFNKGENREEAPPHVVDTLRAYFAPHDERLSTLLGRRIAW